MIAQEQRRIIILDIWKLGKIQIFSFQVKVQLRNFLTIKSSRDKQIDNEK